MSRDDEKPLHPLLALGLGALKRTGEKALQDFADGGIPGVVDGILEDVEGLAGGVQGRTKLARERLAARRRRR